MDNLPSGIIQTKEWSAQQTAIFDWFKNGTGNCLTRARAGTGKTTTILEAINYAREDKILLAAFNKKIAEELKTKLRNPRAEAKTLHSIGFGFVLRNWDGTKLDNERGLKLASMACGGSTAPDQMIALVRRLAALGKNACPFPKAEDMVDLALEHDITPEEQWEEDGWTVERIASCAMKAMDLAATHKDRTVDFDDMVFIPVRNRWVRGRYGLVVIDEAQDMNATQLLLATGLKRPGGRIAVVGDDRQAIYGFRGADAGSLDRLKNELTAVELKLTITYRCPKKVVEYAQRLVPDYVAAPSAPDGIIEDINFDKIHERAEKGNFILSRKNAPLAKICLRLLRHGKRAKIEGREIGQGLLTVMKSVKGKSIPEFLERLTNWEARTITRLQAMKKKSAEIRIEFIKDQAETLRALAEGMASLKEMTARIDELFTETPGGKGDYIICSSIHRSKGLESDTVYVLIETLYPGGKTSIEEQNIDYVAATRAKRKLVWLRDIS
jgi:DNA helicase-2/ATP-dependent DNA helicase PcrA